MVTNMLKAISEMLENSKEEKVHCAKIMLDRIIEGMESTTVTLNGNTASTISNRPSTLTQGLESTNPVYTIEVDPASKVLKWIKRDGVILPPTQLMMIDGKQLPYSKAVGMKFNDIKVVDDAE